VSQVLPVPLHMQGKRLAEATRLAVRAGSGGRMVRDALFKAFWMICEDRKVDYVVIAARSPMDRTYEWLGYSDMVPGAGYIALPYAGSLPHRVLCCHLMTAARQWRESAHPMYEFMAETQHPDISVLGTCVTHPAASESVAVEHH
jgi:hypothetical protein